MPRERSPAASRCNALASFGRMGRSSGGGSVGFFSSRTVSRTTARAASIRVEVSSLDGELAAGAGRVASACTDWTSGVVRCGCELALVRSCPGALGRAGSGAAECRPASLIGAGSSIHCRIVSGPSGSASVCNGRIAVINIRCKPNETPAKTASRFAGLAVAIICVDRFAGS